jgi:hypothetical protein
MVVFGVSDPVYRIDRQVAFGNPNGEKPLTLTLSQRERGLTAVDGRVTPT